MKNKYDEELENVKLAAYSASNAADAAGYWIAADAAYATWAAARKGVNAAAYSADAAANAVADDEQKEIEYQIEKVLEML